MEAQAIFDMSPASGNRDYYAVSRVGRRQDGAPEEELDLLELVEKLREEMFAAAENLEFEKAARLRDRLKGLREEHGDAIDAPRGAKGAKRPKSGSRKAGASRPPAGRKAGGSSGRRASGSGRRRG